MNREKKLLAESAKDMLSNTKKQFKHLGIPFNDEFKDVYISKANPAIINFEPKKNNRWLVTLPKESKIYDWEVSSLKLPEYPFSNGKEFTINLRDVISEKTTIKLKKFLEKQKAFTVKIDFLDPTGVSYEKWKIKGCFITSVTWSDFDYSDDNISTTTLKLTYNTIKIYE